MREGKWKWCRWLNGSDSIIIDDSWKADRKSKTNSEVHPSYPKGPCFEFILGCSAVFKKNIRQKLNTNSRRNFLWPKFGLAEWRKSNSTFRYCAVNGPTTVQRAKPRYMITCMLLDMSIAGNSYSGLFWRMLTIYSYDFLYGWYLNINMQLRSIKHLFIFT